MNKYCVSAYEEKMVHFHSDCYIKKWVLTERDFFNSISLSSKDYGFLWNDSISREDIEIIEFLLKSIKKKICLDERMKEFSYWALFKKRFEKELKK